nr:Chain C, peptide from Trans-activator protein BZLF1 [Human herpesvirus 4 strain B95-8]
RAKFKQLL